MALTMEQRRQKKKERRAWLEQNGLCIRGESHGSSIDGKFCLNCKAEASLMSAKLRASRIKKGLCANAASHGRPEPGLSLCRKCLERQKGYDNGRVRPNKSAHDLKRRHANVAAGLCYTAKSHGAVKPGHTMCVVCLEKIRANSEARRSSHARANLCAKNASHGTATHGRLCDDCHDKNLGNYDLLKLEKKCGICRQPLKEEIIDATCDSCKRKSAERYATRVKDKICVNGASHGHAAPNNVMCAACIASLISKRESRLSEKMCSYSSSHGLAAPGRAACESCLKRGRERQIASRMKGGHKNDKNA